MRVARHEFVESVEEVLEVLTGFRREIGVYAFVHGGILTQEGGGCKGVGVLPRFCGALGAGIGCGCTSSSFALRVEGGHS